MITGLILVPRTAEYLEEKTAVQVAADVVSTFPQVNHIITLKKDVSFTQLRSIKYSEDKVKTNYFYTNSLNDVIREIAHYRIVGKTIAMVYDQNLDIAQQAIQNLNNLINNRGMHVFNQHAVSRIDKVVKDINSDALTFKPVRRDVYDLIVNGRLYKVLDMGECVYVSSKKNKKNSFDTIAVESFADLADMTFKKSELHEHENGKMEAYLKDGKVIVYNRKRKGYKVTTTKLESEMTYFERFFNKDSKAEPFVAYEKSMLGIASDNMKFSSSELSQVVRNEKLKDSGRGIPASAVGNIGLLLDNPKELTDEQRTLAQESLKLVKSNMYGALGETAVKGDTDSDVIPNNTEQGSDSDGDKALILEHQADETNVKIYNNIGPEDAMPNVYTGKHQLDENFIIALNHYKVDGSDAEKRIVNIIETNNINAKVLKATVTDATYKKFMNKETLSSISAKNAIKKLKAYVNK